MVRLLRLLLVAAISLAPVLLEARSVARAIVALPPLEGTLLVAREVTPESEVELRVRNDGLTTVGVARASACSPAFSLTDWWGEDVPLVPQDQPCILVLPKPIPVAPGETVSIGTWDGRGSDGARLATGPYQLHAQLTSAVASAATDAGTSARSMPSLSTISAMVWVGSAPGISAGITSIKAPATIAVSESLPVTLQLTLPAGTHYAGSWVDQRPNAVRCAGAETRCIGPGTTQFAFAPYAEAGGDGGDVTITERFGRFPVGRVELHVLPPTGAAIVRSVTVRSDGPYPDVPGEHWAALYVHDLTSWGVLRGHADGAFHPDWSITRAEVAKVALLASDHEPRWDVHGAYVDLPESHTLRAHLLTALSDGWLEAGPDHAWPDRPATRYETLKALMDAFGITPQPAASPAFPDASSGLEADYSTTAKEAGIVSGNAGRFLPGDQITRAEVAKIVWELLTRAG